MITKNHMIKIIFISLLITNLFLAGCVSQSLPAIQVTEDTGSTPPTTQPIVREPTATPKIIVTLQGNFEANGHSLSIICIGTGSPTIILESGEGGTISDMFDLQESLSKRTTTCAYDRANIGSSDSAPTPRTGQDAVDDLHALLATAHVPSPYVLVGESAGGMFVQLYARTFPGQVVGVVAMNPVPPAHPWLEEVSQVFTASEYTDEEAYYQGQNGESFDYLTSSKQLAAATKPPNVPFEMLLSTIAQCDSTTDVCGKSYSTYEQIMKEVTAAWPRGHFSQVAASHEIYVDNIDAVVATVERILASP